MSYIKYFKRNVGHFYTRMQKVNIFCFLKKLAFAMSVILIVPAHVIYR